MQEVDADTSPPQQKRCKTVLAPSQISPRSTEFTDHVNSGSDVAGHTQGVETEEDSTPTKRATSRDSNSPTHISEQRGLNNIC